MGAWLQEKDAGGLYIIVLFVHREYIRSGKSYITHKIHVIFENDTTKNTHCVC